MMLLKEFLEGENLFTVINNVEYFEFLQDGNALILDEVIRIEYGDKIMFHPYNHLSILALANILVSVFGDKWRKYLAMELLSANASNRIVTSETVNSSDNKLNTSTIVNKVSGFNASTMVDNDSTNNEVVEGNTGVITKSNTVENIAPLNDFNSLDSMIKNSILDKVMKDVVNRITIQIY
jgi:hypothetical protein